VQKLKSGPRAVPNGTNEVIIGIHRDLKRKGAGPGQSHHLNQDAVYKKVIPSNDAVTIKLKGNAFTEIGTPHYKAHASMELFWNQYRRGGFKFGYDQLTRNIQRLCIILCKRLVWAMSKLCWHSSEVRVRFKRKQPCTPNSR